MAEDTSSSFIPKRNPAKKIKRAVTRRVYLFTFFSYVLLFVALILSAALFGYKLVLENRVVDNIEALNAAIASFSVADMQSVVELDARLRLAEERVANHLSMAAFLTLIEASTVQSVQLQDMNIVRDSDNLVVVTAKITTPDFDSALFQRQVYEQSEELSGVSLENITFSLDGTVASPGTSGNRRQAAPAVTGPGGDDEPVIAMTAVYRINAEDIPFVPPQQAPAVTPSEVESDTQIDSSDTAAESDDEDDEDDGEAVSVQPFNQNDI